MQPRKRRKADQINSLQDNKGDKVEWSTGLGETMIGHFSQLFTAIETEWGSVTSCVSNRVTMEQNEMLLAEVEEKEVRTTLFNMHPYKSPSPDGMSPGFY